MLALSGLSSIFTWGSICLAHIRFRQAWKEQGHSLEELPFKSQSGVIGSWIGFAVNVLILIVQFWTGVWPIGYEELTLAQQVKKFFMSYLGAPIILTFYISFKLFNNTKIKAARHLDVDTGVKTWESARLREQDRLEHAAWPRWKKIYKLFC
jgi:amino acid transporter